MDDSAAVPQHDGIVVLKCLGGAILGAIGGFVAWFVCGVGLWIVVGLLTWNSRTGEAAASFAALLIPVGIVIGITVPLQEEADRRRKANAAEEARRQAAEAAEEARRQRHKEEQEGYRNELTALGERSLVLFESMPDHLGSAEDYLTQAEVEFADGAFAPFWDCIENGAKMLGRFDESVRHIKDSACRYTQLVKQYEDAPPMFPLAHHTVTRLSVGTATAERMQAIVRRAQRDFQFATIYEQRKTNQILVAGFTNLAHALQHMTRQIAASIDALADSVDVMGSTLDASIGAMANEASKAASDAAAREERALEMLDNIQRGRRPSP